MSEHLDEVVLEALSTGRDDLVPEEALAHLDECAHCAELVALEQMAVEDASLALERVLPELDVDRLVSRAMEKAPDPALGAAPSRRSLWMGGALGAIAATALGVLSLPERESLDGLSTVGSQLYTLARAFDGVVDAAVPGGWTALSVAALLLGLVLVVPMRFFLGGKPLRAGPAVTSMLAVGLLVVLSGPWSLAHAYRVEGAWPSPEPRVTVDVERQPTSEALRQATASAGLGIVVRLPDDPLVTLHVRNAPIGEVLEALLGTSDVVVRPGPSLITVRVDDAPAPAEEPGAEATAEPVDVDPVAAEPVVAEPVVAEPVVAPVEPVAPVEAVPLAVPSVPEAPVAPAAPGLPAPPSAIADRVTFGADVAIGADEQVRDVVTMGGSAAVAGRAFGDVFTMGGDADITGEVVGDVVTMGGDIHVGEAARIHGDINAMGGDVDIEEGATVRGRVLDTRATASHGPSRHHDLGKGSDWLAGTSRWALFNVLVFLFGLFLMGAYRQRFSTLRMELAARPMRSAIGGFFGCGAAVMICAVLTLTIIGIPGSMVLGTLLVVGGGVGFAATAWWLGGVLPIGKTHDRPVLQLGIGLGVLFAVGLVPFLGKLVVVTAGLAGLGAVISTSFGQRATAQKPRNSIPTGPFRAR